MTHRFAEPTAYIRLDPDLKAGIAAIAAENDQTQAAVIRQLLREALAARKAIRRRL
jgi:predicted transcriptional regulator